MYQIPYNSFFKVGFFSESAIRFSNLPISPQKYTKSLSWTWNLKFSPITVNSLYEFQTQVSDLGSWEIWKTNLTFWKKHL